MRKTGDAAVKKRTKYLTKSCHPMASVNFRRNSGEWVSGAAARRLLESKMSVAMRRADFERHAAQFWQLAPGGLLGGGQARDVLGRTGLAVAALRAVWDLSDLNEVRCGLGRSGGLEPRVLFSLLRATRAVCGGTPRGGMHA